MNYKFIAGLFIIAGLISCGQKSDETGKKGNVEILLPTDEVEVSTVTLRTTDFEHELVSNGRISSRQIAELRFLSSSAGNMPVDIFIKNGDRVQAGAAIAMLDTFQLSNSFKQAEDNLEKAYLELQNVLIGQGFVLKDSALIPKETLRLAHVRSGYNSAKIQYDLAKYNLDNAILRTPIAGTVINLFSKPHTAINTSEPFCTIINEGELEVDFKILENELPMIKLGDKVKIRPYASSDIETTGTVANINPSVNKEGGTVNIKAYVQPHSGIFNGMNVSVSVYRSLGKHWIVPKSAVVIRTNKQVVFAYKNGKAAWNYVETGYQNATHYSITSKTLQEGDEIIYEGNEHLADMTVVKLVNSNSNTSE